MELKTPLYETHVKYKGKIVPFAGYLLPVQYETGVIKEHMAVRTACGLFDVSHMGEITCIGKDAVKNLNHLLTNDYTTMYDGQARYSPMCNEEGGVVDDLIVYKVREEHYLIVVNAANKDKDYEWIKNHVFGDVEIKDISDQVAQIALQGPKALEVLKKVAKEEDIPVKYYSATFRRKIDDMECIISKTGYTGENGFELYLAAEEAPKMWELLLEAGKEEGLFPCGLGARDTLRLEAAMPLYGHEMDDTVTPLEAGLGWITKLTDGNDFVGRDVLEKQKAEGVTRKLAAFTLSDKGIPRQGYKIVNADGEEIGEVTSGTMSPMMKVGIGMGYLKPEYTKLGTEIFIQVRKRNLRAEVVKPPFRK